jgi:hypothetical protein
MWHILLAIEDGFAGGEKLGWYSGRRVVGFLCLRHAITTHF